MLYCHTVLLYYIFVQNARGARKNLLPADVYPLFVEVDARVSRVTARFKGSLCHGKLEVDGKELVGIADRNAVYSEHLAERFDRLS